MTRIRYTKTNENTLHSTKPVLFPNGTLVNIVLTVDVNGKCEYDFFDATGAVISNGSSNSLVSLKKLVKDTLITCGVTFHPEVRNRKSKNTEEAA